MPSYLAWFLSPGGILVLSAIDSSVAFFLPLANDTLVIYLAARDSAHFWIYPLLATIGSLIGCATTYRVGQWLGEEGVERWASPRQFERVKQRIHGAGAFALAVPALIPPPFPFTPFVLAAGALDVRPWTFFALLAVGRISRFMVEAVLARLYPHRLIQWMQSNAFRDIVWGFVFLALVGSAWSVYMVVRKARSEARHRRGRPA